MNVKEEMDVIIFRIELNMQWIHAKALTAISFIRPIGAIRGFVAHPCQCHAFPVSRATRELFRRAILISYKC